MLAEIRKLTDQPIRYIINTSADADSVGGNASSPKPDRAFSRASTDPRSGFVKAMTGGAASILAPENVLLRMSAPTGKAAPYPSDAWPSETFSTNRRYLYSITKGLRCCTSPRPIPTAIAWSSSGVRTSSWPATFWTRRVSRSSTWQKAAAYKARSTRLNRLIELAIPPIPFVFPEGGTLVIPGHGRIYDQADVVEYRDMIVIVRDVIQDMMQRGMTLDQIKAANPAQPYEKQYGAKSGPWTTDDFVEAVYKSLTAAGVRNDARPIEGRNRLGLRKEKYAARSHGDDRVHNCRMHGLWSRPGSGPWSGGPPPTSEGGCSHRSDRLLGFRRHRGLALPHGHASQGRLSERSHDRGSRKKVADAWDPAKDEAAGEQCKSYGAAGIMRIPERLHITWQDDNTLKMEIDAGHADARVPLRKLEIAGRRGHLARRFGRPMGSTHWGTRRSRRRKPRRRNPIREPESCDDPHEGGVSSQERRALQRQRDDDRVLRRHTRAQRRSVADSDVDRPRSALSARALYDQHALSETGRRCGMGSDAVLGKMVMT